MSVQAPSSFNLGFHRALLTTIRATPAGGNIRCPICGGRTRGGVILHEAFNGSITGTLHCRDRHCFSVVERIERPRPRVEPS